MILYEYINRMESGIEHWQAVRYPFLRMDGSLNGDRLDNHRNFYCANCGPNG